MIYAIGRVGEEPTILHFSDPSDVAAIQLQQDQVKFQITSKPTRRVVIVEKNGTYDLDPYTYTIEYMRTWFWNKTKSLRQDKISAGCSTTFGLIDSDDVSVNRVNTAAVSAAYALQSGEDFSISWVLKNNEMVSLTAQEMLSLQKQLTDFINICQVASQTIRTQILSASTQSELEALDLEAGYPS